MATARKTTKKAAPKKAAPVEEIEEVEEEETAPAKKVGNGEEVTFGASDLAELLKERTGQDVSTRQLRTLLRKMARDGRINREIIPGNRARYNWSGPEDPEVQAVVAAFEDGELERDKQEKLAALKERKAAEKAAAEKSGKAPAKKTRKAKAAPVEDEDDEDLELDDDEE